MPDAFEIYGGLWWRFDRYEIWTRCIRPAEGAVLESYDPWASYRGAWAADPESPTQPPKRRRRNPPYVTLINLVEKLSFRASASGRGVLTPEGEGLLTKWCASQGLLGILPQKTFSVTLSPRWQGDKLEEPYSMEQNRYIRTNEGWKSLCIKSGYYEPEDEWRPRPSDEELLDGFARPTVLLQTGLTSAELVQESLNKTWAEFFPAVPPEKRETFTYSLPLSNEWWCQYAEPIDEFLDGAIAFREALKALKANQKVPDDDYSRLEFGIGLRTLNALTASVGLSTRFQPDSTTFRQQWEAPSLLASFAVMASLDLTLGNKRLIQCRACNQYLVSQAYQASYCSETCSNTAAKRRQRSNNKKKERRKKDYGKTRTK